MPTTRHFIINGRVQGVGFRAATCDKARELGLAGWVRNLPDGDVELIAAGDEGSLDRLAEWLARGPRMARVDDVEQRPASDGQELPSTFEIR